MRAAAVVTILDRAARALLLLQLTAASLCLLVLVGCVLGQFLSRALLGSGIHWASELARFSFVWAALLGAAAAWQSDALHRLDLFARKLPDRLRPILEGVVVLGVLAASGYLLHFGLRIAERVANQTSSTLEISMAWVYAAAPATAALMIASTLLTLPVRLAAARAPRDVDEAQP